MEKEPRNIDKNIGKIPEKIDIGEISPKVYKEQIEPHDKELEKLEKENAKLKSMLVNLNEISESDKEKKQ